MPGLQGQIISSPEALGALPIGGKIYHYIGNSPEVIARPAGKKMLIIHAENDNARVRIGRMISEFGFSDEDILEREAHGLETGDGPFVLTTTDALPAGLATSTDYWIIRLDADTFSFAASYADALDGTAVNVTDAGTGEHTYDAISAVTEVPASSDTEGNGSFLLSAAVMPRPVVFTAPEHFTIIGYDAATAVTYWWL